MSTFTPPADRSASFSPAERRTLVHAYAHAMLEDILASALVANVAVPKSLAEWPDRDLVGDRFEDTALQGNFSHFSIGCAVGDAEQEKIASALWTDAQKLVDRWLVALWLETQAEQEVGYTCAICGGEFVATPADIAAARKIAKEGEPEYGDEARLSDADVFEMFGRDRCEKHPNA